MSDELQDQATDVQPSGQGDPAAAQSQVQPEGQGREDSNATGLYDLSSVPEEYRSHVERIAKDIDRNVQAKLQEAAQFRKDWAPFDELGVRDLGADNVGALVALAQALASEDTAQSAVLELARAVGLTVDESDGEPQEEVDPLQARLEALEAREAQRQQEVATQQELTRLQQEWAEVEKEHGRPFDQEESNLLISLADRFDNEAEPIKAAFTLFNQIAGFGEKRLVRSKANEPRAAEPAGSASTAVTPPQTFEEAKAALVERRRALNAA